MKKYRVYILLLVLSLVFLAGCGSNVRVGGVKCSIDAQSITAPLREGEIKKLDKLTNLDSADFSGSTCYEEIVAWAEAHPDVSVTYTVEFPDGTVVKSTDKQADLSAVESAQVAESVGLLAYLPELSQVTLGSTLSFEDFLQFAKALPEASFDYAFSFMDKDCSTSTKELDLTGISGVDVDELIKYLPYMADLKLVELGDENSSDISFEDIATLQEIRPDVDFKYSFTLFEKTFTTLDTSMDLNHITMDDEGAAVKEVLPCMKKLKYLDMDFCNVSNEAMAAIRDAYPEVEVVWRIWFGLAYSVRTDAIKILASKPSVGGNLHNEDVDVLKYCTKIKYLDLGHNGDGGDGGITDLSFVRYMPDLEVLIIAMNDVSDLSPLEDCPKLEYLEIFSTPISDLSPLANATALRHLRIDYMPNLTDISPLYGLKDLERLWLDFHTPIPPEQIEKMQECAPNCEIDTGGSNRWTVLSLSEITWRYTYAPRYELLREQFGYDTLDYSFYWLDPKY